MRQLGTRLPGGVSEMLDHSEWFRREDGGWLLLTQPYPDPAEHLAEWCPTRGLTWMALPWSPYATGTHAALIFGAEEHYWPTDQPLAVFLRERLSASVTSQMVRAG